MIINLYKQYKFYDQALRVSEQHATHLISNVRREMTMLSNNPNNYIQNNRIESTGDESLSNLQKERSSLMGSASEDLNKLNYEQIQDRIELAQKRSNKEEEAKYALMLSAKNLSISNYTKALNVINRFNVLLVLEETRKLLLRISSKLFAMEDVKPDDLEIWKLLRDTLFNLFTSKSVGNEYEEQLEHHLIIAHFLCLKTSLSKLSKQLTDSKNKSSMLNSVNELNLKLSIAFLRYSDLVRVDYLFYEAGQLCKQANRTNLAFIFLNHFLDLVDAIEEQDANLVDYSNLEQTDIPSEVPLPRTVFLFQGDHLVAKKKIEKIKSWILEKSMENSEFSLQLNDRTSSTNGVDHNQTNSIIYETGLLRNDENQSMYCLVTAYPILDKEQQFELKPGKYAVNRSDWNQLIMILKV